MVPTDTLDLVRRRTYGPLARSLYRPGRYGPFHLASFLLHAAFLPFLVLAHALRIAGIAVESLRLALSLLGRFLKSDARRPSPSRAPAHPVSTLADIMALSLDVFCEDLDCAIGRAWDDLRGHNPIASLRDLAGVLVGGRMGCRSSRNEALVDST